MIFSWLKKFTSISLAKTFAVYLIQSSFYCVKFFLLKELSDLTSLSQLAFGVLCIEGIVLFAFNRPLYNLKSANKGFKPLDLILAFCLIALFHTLILALNSLPLSTAFTLYLSYPLFVPWILRIWMGKKIFFRHRLLLFCLFPLTLFYFRTQNHLEHLAILLALTASLLKAFEWVARRRFYLPNNSLFIPKEPYFLATLFSIPLLFQDPFELKAKSIVYFLGYILITFTKPLALKQLKVVDLPSLGNAITFSLTLCICLICDFFIFKKSPSFTLLSSSCLMSFFIFLVFSQKKILPNPQYDL